MCNTNYLVTVVSVKKWDILRAREQSGIQVDLLGAGTSVKVQVQNCNS